MSTGNQTGQQAMEQEHNGQQVEKEKARPDGFSPFPVAAKSTFRAHGRTLLYRSVR
ncbi:hypothetical protein MT997_06900 [Paenibacillus sp. OVF10]|nr:hypothetical protein MT997_06900 [Paenibacillus sp. OVF10]